MTEQTEQNATLPLVSGVYPVAPGCHAFVSNGRVHVFPKRRKDDLPRCRNCRYFQQGYHSYSRRTLSYVCMRKPKPLRRVGLPNEVNPPVRYYVTSGVTKACDMYEPIKQK